MNIYEIKGKDRHLIDLRTALGSKGLNLSCLVQILVDKGILDIDDIKSLLSYDFEVTE